MDNYLARRIHLQRGIWQHAVEAMIKKQLVVEEYLAKPVSHYGYFSYSVFKKYNNGVFTGRWYFVASSRDSNKYCCFLDRRVCTVCAAEDADAEAVLFYNGVYEYVGIIKEVSELRSIAEALPVTAGDGYTNDLWVSTHFAKLYV